MEKWDFFWYAFKHFFMKFLIPSSHKPMLQKRKIANELHQRFQYYGRNALQWKRKCILMLPEIEKERVWEQKGFGSIHEYASRLAGISRSCVDDALRIIHAVQDKPEIMKVVEQYGVNAIAQFTQVDHERLSKLAELADQGIIKVHIDKTFPLQKAGEALSYLQEGHPRGKVVLSN